MARMMDYQIRELLEAIKSQPSENLESETVEFKGYRDEQALHNAKDLAEEISALANGDGGTIVIGVCDGPTTPSGGWALQLRGFPVVDALATQERLQGRLQPRIPLAVSNFSFEGTNFAVVRVPHKPDTLVSTTSGKTCKREGRSSRPMTPSEIEQAVKGLVSYDWSAEPLDLTPALVLDPGSLEGARQDFAERRKLEAMPDSPSFLEAIGATKNGTLTNAGLLFLGSEEAIRSHLGDFEYRFSWKTKAGDLRINDVWQGNLWSAVNRAKAHFRTCNQKHRFKYKEREFDVPMLDEIAFHEAYLNALVHRDYSTEGMVSVNFTGDRIVITSPGEFYGGVTADNIALHEPRHRNKALARVLMAHNLVDRAGMGVLRMGLHSLRYGRGFPSFREAPDSVEVSMEGEFLRPHVTVLALDNVERFGIPELLILNTVYETGVASVAVLEEQLGRLTSDPWEAIQRAVANIAEVELCGTSDGLFVRVRREAMQSLNVTRIFRVSTNSEKHVALYSYLKRHTRASNADIREVLGHAYSSQTSRFLREARYVARSGSGPSARWFLTNAA